MGYKHVSNLQVPVEVATAQERVSSENTLIDSNDSKEYGIQESTNYKGAEGNSHTYVKKVTWADI